MKLLILADDLTGAIDTAAQISKRCVKTLAAAEPGDLPGDCEALSVNLNMRHDSPDAAFDKVSALLRQFPDVPYTYIKTDSVLRGNLSAAFAAALAERNGRIMFVPAYPKAGRTTVGGIQYVSGIPLEKSVFAQDPLNPMKTGCVREILNMSHAVSRECVEIFDCGTQEKLEWITENLHSQDALRLTAGCAGFAEALAGYIPFEREHASFTPDSGPALLLNGSASPVTFEQLSHGKERGIPVVNIPLEAEAMLAAGSSVALSSADLSILAAAAQRFVQAGYMNLAVFGGDTAFAVLRGIGCGHLRVITEIQPGVPLSAVYRGIKLNVVTKSGGLGNVDAVTVIDRYLRTGR